MHPGEDEALQRLQQVKHIVVLMMENRSFDQMLGFLQNDGLDVEGIAGAKPNFDADGNEYKPFEWGPGQTMPPTPPGLEPKILDPCHSPACVGSQLKRENGGFVRNFAATRRDKAGNKVGLEPEYLGVPMGHFGAQHLPVYRHLAHNFCVCDRWHSSIPGDTWPNRLYSLAGRDGPSIGHKPGVLSELLKDVKGIPAIGKITGAPIFEVEAFTRQLHDSQWRWYSHDPATLRAADAYYRDFRHLKRDNFTYFDRKKISWETEAAELAIVTHDSFLDDAAKGELRDVSWIDPNFIDLNMHESTSNDDHPPSDVKEGQALVLEIYEALASSPNWADTVLVIVYDEHGGFYDHVAPPPVNDRSGYKTLGVRVPALVVGPRVRKFVCHEVLEHTSLIATILRRFAANPDHAIAAMPERVQRAPHLGMLLEPEPRSDLEPPDQLREEMANWQQEARRRRQAGDGEPSPSPDGVGHPMQLHDFQEEFVKFSLAMRDAGLPPGQP
ncbi:MAG: alkaline phosphatase family protein [Solirubrobacterales bacterium]